MRAVAVLATVFGSWMMVVWIGEGSRKAMVAGLILLGVAVAAWPAAVRHEKAETERHRTMTTEKREKFRAHCESLGGMVVERVGGSLIASLYDDCVFP